MVIRSTQFNKYLFGNKFSSYFSMEHEIRIKKINIKLLILKRSNDRNTSFFHKVSKIRNASKRMNMQGKVI